VAAPPPPAPAADDSKKALMIGGGVVVAGLLLLGIYMGGSSPTERRATEPPPATEDLGRLLQEFEKFAATATPDRILSRCDDLRSKFRGAPQEKRFQAIESAAKQRELEVQLGRDLEAIQKIIDGDPQFGRFDEVVRKFKAAKAIAGPRAGEVDRRLADYEALRRASPQEKHLGPYEPDEQGCVRHWLVLGLFPNDRDEGLDTDFLNGEAAHDPVAGLEAGKAKWAAHESQEAKVDFFKVAHLRGKSKDNVVAYAACLVQVPVTVAAEFRLGSDDGAALWVDGRQVGKVHRSRSFKVDEDRYSVPLSPGVHRVLVKVENHTKQFEFTLRIVGPDGNRVPALRVWN
jgi:hypothetical protein